MPAILKERKLPSHVARVSSMEEWSEIHVPSVNLVVMGREFEPPAELQDSHWPRDFHLQLDSRKSMDASNELRRSLSFLAPVLRDWFTADILTIIRGFANLDPEPFRVSLMPVHAVMCPAFHADFYNYRLITTYRGPGTEWMPDSNVNRAGFGSDDYADRILNPDEIRSIPTGHIALMKGERGSEEVRGVVHRSPVNPHGAPPRIVLRMDR